MSEHCECDDDMTEDGHGRGCPNGIAYVRAQRDELAEALRLFLERSFEPCTCDEDREHPRCDFHASFDAARAALAKVKP